MSNVSASAVQTEIAKGLFKPNIMLTNMSMAFYQNEKNYVAKTMFPTLPVQLSTSSYYIFSKGDLARDGVQKKPQFGKVAPIVPASTTDSYSVEVEQIIMGIDQIQRLDLQRTKAPGSVDPRKAKTKVIAEQMNIHQDIKFADAFLKTGVWTKEYTGVTETPAGKQFYKFSDANFEPIKFFDNLKAEMLETGRREPNRLGLGIDAYNALKENGDLLERIKYSGSSANPALVNEKILAELLGIEKVVVFKSTYNAAGIGEEDDMRYICDPKASLLCYATSTPMIDEPSAGYTFTWDMLGDGNYLPVRQFEGEPGTHSEFIEGLMAVSQKKTCDELGVFLSECC